MKRTIVIILTVYVLVIGVLFYVFLGAGVLSGFKSLKWQGIETQVPPDFKVKEYRSKGWQVYALSRISAFIKIARKPAVNVFELSRYEKEVVLEKRTPLPEPATYYVVKEKKLYTVVAAASRDNTTLYISVSTFSLFFSRYIMGRMLQNFTFNGEAVTFPSPVIPLKLYGYDLLIVASFLLPLIILIPIFYFSGKTPNPQHFQGETILCEEKFVYTTFQKKWNRSNTFCYLALTSSRLVIFCFGKLKLEIKLDEERPDIAIRGRKIILEHKDKTIILRPADIDRWQSCLSSFHQVSIKH
jgi:hypothetical protein